MHGNLRQDNFVRRSEINALKPLPYTFARHSFACFDFSEAFFRNCPSLPYIVLCWSILSYCREKSGLLVEKEACQPGPPLQSFHVSEWRNLESQVARSRSRLRGESWASYLAKVSRAHHLDLNPEHVRWEDLWKILTCGRCSRGIQAISSSALKGLERRVLHTLL